MADTKNYGLKGVGDDVQFGKQGGRFVFNTGAADFRATTDGTTLSHLQVLTPVGDTDAATKLYVDNVAAGLDHKESCQAATTAAGIGTYATSPSNGQFTGVAATIDGVTLAQFDRVLVKNQADAKQNGIYEVQATTTTLTRASDMDGSPASEVSAGNFTFVEAGTVNADSGWVLQGDGELTLNTDNLNWVLFSTSGDIIAGDALTKTSNSLHLDFVNGGGLTSATATAGADQIAFADATGGDAMFLRTWTNVLADLDIVTATANGMIVRTSADNYASRTITASAVAGDEGISIVNGDGVSGNPTIGIDILGQTNLVTDSVDDADELIMYHSVAGGTEGVGNYAVAASKLKTYMNAGTSSTSITEGDSTLAVSDTGTDGTLTWTADNVIVLTIDDTVATFSNGLDITMATGSTITVADLTNNDVLIAGTAGLIEDSAGALTFDGTTLNVTGAATVDNISIDGNTISSTAGIDLLLTPLAGQQLILDTAIIVDNGSMTGITTLGFDTVSLTNIDISTEFTDNDVSIMTSAAVDDRILSYGYSTTVGTITGTVANDQVVIGTGATSIDSGANLTFNGTTLTVAGVLIVDEITIDGDVISNNTTNQPLILRPNGTGSIIFQNGSSEETLELIDITAAVNGLSITPGITGTAGPQIGIGSGGEANVDIGFVTAGTGVLSVAGGAGTYEDNVTAGDDIPNKTYVDNAIEALGGSGSVDTIIESISLATPGVITIGAATGIPANCTIISTMVDITTLADTAVTVTVGDTTNGAASYMAAAENDPEVAETFIADGRLLNGAGARQANATIAGVDSTVGNATIIITFRHA